MGPQLGILPSVCTTTVEACHVHTLSAILKNSLPSTQVSDFTEIASLYRGTERLQVREKSFMGEWSFSALHSFIGCSSCASQFQGRHYILGDDHEEAGWALFCKHC